MKTKMHKCPTEEELIKQGFKPIEYSVFHPDDLLQTDMLTGEMNLDKSMLGHFAVRYMSNFINEGLKQGQDWEIGKRDDGTFIICTKN